MGTLSRQLLLFGVCFAPVVLVCLVVRVHVRARREASKVPFEELRRRPAGESLRLKLAAMDERIDELGALLVVAPLVVAMAGTFDRSQAVLFAVPAFVFCALWAAGFGWRLHRLLHERANHQLGYDGERFVGEELNRLAARGFEVYHDLPFDGFNIDHVLVGRQGVFVVETKTRRKPVNGSGEKQYRVEFDGYRLHWPWGKDDYGVQQALNNARTVSEWLSKAVGEPVSAMPILTLPGWMVDRKAPGKGVHVLNPKEIAKLCDNKAPNLSDNLVRRIGYQLEERCKLTLG
jgi:hypothetical protein